jgi:cell division protein FtsB
MLRQKTKNEIIAILDDSYFGLSNFDLTFSDGKNIWLTILFIPNYQFVYEVTSRSSSEFPFVSSAAPGIKFLAAERDIHSKLEEAISGIPAWLERIKEEVLDSNPIIRELDRVRNELNERINKLEDQNDFFSIDEVSYLIDRLDELQTKFDALSGENEELRAAVAVIEQNLMDLKDASEKVNKATWYRMAGSKLLKGAKSVMGSKEARQFALEAAKKMLLEGPK